MCQEVDSDPMVSIRVADRQAHLIGDPKAPKTYRRIGNLRGLLILMLTQVIAAAPVFVVAGLAGGTHIQQAWLAGAVVWPLVILSYLPLLFWTISDAVIVPVYLAVMVRMFGTLGAVVAMRQIAAPLVPDSWFAYISALYFVGLVAEAALAVSHVRIGGKTPVGESR